MNQSVQRRWRHISIVAVILSTFATISNAATSFAGVAGANGLNAANEAPRAQAGADLTVITGQTVTLDATDSTDRDGDRLHYAWTLQSPPGSGARLSDPTAARPTFTVDMLGDYVASVVAFDGKQNSTPATVRISTGNVAPVADPGPDRRIAVGQGVALDARASYDANHDALTYLWKVVESPALSRASVASMHASSTYFTADREGEYVLSLTASDGRLDSSPVQVRLSTGNVAPRADAGLDRRVVAGAALQIGSRELTADGADLAYSWSLIHTPANSAARLDDPHSATPVLRTSVPGLYVAQLIVSDGMNASAPDTMVVEALARTGVVQSLAEGAADTDGDGVVDTLDNCVQAFNPTQLDTNGDGFGNRCDADLDNDGFVTNVSDLGLLKLAFFTEPGDPNWDPDADFNGDLVVNAVDLGIMKFYFFGPPGPIAITFINPAGGSWHDPTNWSPQIVPNIQYSVRIDLDPGVLVEYSTGSSTIAGIRTTSPLLISGGELIVEGDALFNDTLTLETGATLTNANILPPTVDPAPVIEIANNQNVTLDGVTLGSDLSVGSASAQLTILNGLTLSSDATVSINSIGNGFSTLSFQGVGGATSTLGGNGNVTFSGDSSLENRGRLLVGSSTHGLIIESGITISSDTIGGAIFHANNNGPITMGGTLVSDVIGNLVTLSAAPLTIAGDVQVSNDAMFQASFLGVGGTIGSLATLGVNTGEIELFGDFVQDGTITVTNSTLDLGNAVGDEWSNTGTITLSGATLELGGTFALADVGTITGTGTTVINGTFVNTGLTVDLQSALPGTVELASGAVILGGTLNGGALPIPNGQAVTFDGVELVADVSIGSSSAQLTILNGLTLSGGATVSINSIGNGFSTLSFQGAGGATSTLGGFGSVTFSGDSSLENRGRLLVGSSTHGLIIESGITISSDTIGGAIFHANNNGPITMGGTLVSDVIGNLVTLSAAPLTIAGDVQVSNDSTFVATFLGVGGAITSMATLDVNTGEIELLGDFTQDGTITVTDSTLDFGNAVGDEWSNTGTIVLNNATLELGGTFMLSDVGNITGTGTTVINGTFVNTGMTVDLLAALPGTVEFASGAVILGGTLNGGALPIPNGQVVTFDGVTLGADVSIGSGSAQLTILNGLTLSGDATVSINSIGNGFSTLSFQGAGGATSTLGGDGNVTFSGDSSLENRGRLLVGSSTHGLIIESGITISSDTIGGAIFHTNNNGPITVRGAIVADVTGDFVTLSGSPLTIEGAGGDVQVSNDATFQASFLGVGGTIGSLATLGVNTGEIELFGDFVQDGTITVTNSTLDLGNAVGDEWSNTGTITLSGATLELGGTFTLADVGTITGTGTTFLNGTFVNAGLTVDLQSALPGTVELASGTIVLGGTLNGGALTIPSGQSVTFDGVTLSADVSIGSSSAQLTILNGLTLSGGATVSINSLSNGFSTLSFQGAGGATSTLGGNGNVTFSGDSSLENRGRLLVGSSTHGLIIDSGITVSSDTIGGAIFHANNNGPITVRGTIVADVTGDFVTLSGSPLTIEGAGGDVQVSNDATFQASFLGVGGTIGSLATLGVNTGEIELFGDFVQDGTITVTNSTLDLGNAVGDEWSNTGTITLSGATLELGGTFALADVGTITGTGTTVINGTFVNTGLMVDLQSALPGTVELASGAVILGGTLNGGALTIPNGQAVTFDDVELVADVSIGSGSAQLTILNGLTLTGDATVSINSLSNGFSTLSFQGAGGATSTLDGFGNVTFSGDSSLENRGRLLVGSSTHGLIIESGITVSSDTIGGTIQHASNNGPITIQGDVVSDVANDTVSLSASPLTIEGDLDIGAGAVISAGIYTLGSGATLNVDVGGLATTEFGRFTSGSGATLDGTLNLTLVNGFSPSLADTFQIMTFNSRTGTFAAETGTSIGGGLSFQVNYNATDVTLEVVN